MMFELEIAETAHVRTYGPEGFCCRPIERDLNSEKRISAIAK